MMFTLPPSFYVVPKFPSPTMPSIPIFPDFDLENNTLAENNDYIQTTTPKNNVFVSKQTTLKLRQCLKIGLITDCICFSSVWPRWMNRSMETYTEHEEQISLVIGKLFVLEYPARSKHSYQHGTNSILSGDFSNFLLLLLNMHFIAHRIQSLQGLLSYSHWDVPISNIKGEVLFRSWKDLFETNGEMLPQAPRLYSFNGRDVIHDSTW